MESEQGDSFFEFAGSQDESVDFHEYTRTDL